MGRRISPLRYSRVKIEVLRDTQDDKKPGNKPQDDRQGQNRGPSPPGMLRDRLAQDDKNEIKPEILPAEKNAVRMTDPAIGRFSIKVVNVWQNNQPG